MSDAVTYYRKKLNTADAAEYLSLGKSTLDKLRVVGGGPVFYRLNKRVVYDPADLDAWLNAHKRTSTSEAAATAA